MAGIVRPTVTHASRKASPFLKSPMSVPVATPSTMVRIKPRKTRISVLERCNAACPERMFSRTLPTTATGPGTMVGGKFSDSTYHRASSARIERTLRIEVIADEIFRNGFHDRIAENFVHQLQIILLNVDL